MRRDQESLSVKPSSMITTVMTRHHTEERPRLITAGPEADIIETAESSEDDPTDKKAGRSRRNGWRKQSLLPRCIKGHSSSSSSPSPSTPSRSASSSSALSSFYSDSLHGGSLKEERKALLDDKDGEDEDKAKEIEMTMTIEEDDENVQDKGFAWVIVFGGFLSQVLSGGLMRTDAILYAQFLDRYGESSQLTSWPGALSFTIQCFIAPVAALFCNRFSVRTAVILGTFLIIIGLVITAFAPNIYLLFLSYSVLLGIGRGLVLAPGIFIINIYFDRYRGVALGLSFSGTGFATFALAPLFEKLFKLLGYQNTLLVIAGLSSIGFVAAATFRPLSTHKRMMREKRQRENIRQDYKERASHLETGCKRQQNYFPSYGATDSSCNAHNQFSNNNSNHVDEILVKDSNYSEVTEIRVKPGCSDNQRRTCSPASVARTFPVEQGRARKRKSGPLFHWALFRDFPFLVLCISMAFFTLAQKTVFSFLDVVCLEQGLSSAAAASVLSLTGIGDLVGRLLSGILMDLPRMKPFREAMYSFVLFIAAGAVLMFPFSKTLVLLGTAGVIYGVMVGASASQKSTILVALLGKEMVNSAFGILYSFQGLGTMIGPPIAGALKDKFDTYSLAYFMSGGSMVGAGVLVAVSAILFALRRRRHEGIEHHGYMRLPSDDFSEYAQPG
ncbi:monocarboxylate transporter 9 [Plakobranchus ocellatus]|uniref:Monocarboxylate transporter 9 n=1 Tax=Plakobranchus ocellatus TaxID=259542 RepID=A0AAV3ZGA1_9GAST|nr:monocarboxylate transporter 9 [Plakobranchus ocellatus]